MTVDPSKFTEKRPLKEPSTSADKWGLDIAYGMPSGVFIQGDTMYIAGTKSLRDIVDDTLIPFSETQRTQRFADAEKRLKPRIKRIVGHSLGGSVALELAKRHNLESETYGAPVFFGSESSTRHRHNWDPISFFDRGASSTSSPGWNPHSY